MTPFFRFPDRPNLGAVDTMYMMLKAIDFVPELKKNKFLTTALEETLHKLYDPMKWEGLAIDDESGDVIDNYPNYPNEPLKWRL